MPTSTALRPVAAVALALLAALLAPASGARADLVLPIGNGDRVLGRLEPGSEVESFRFDAAAGAKLTITLKATPTKGSKSPVLTLRVLDDAETDLADGHVTRTGHTLKLTKLVIPAGDSYRIVVTGDGRPGNYDLRASWTAAKPTNRVLRVGAKEAPAIQTDSVVGVFVGKGGATPDPAVTLPAGAVSRTMLLLVGSAHDLRPTNDSALTAGPAVFLGPEGLQFPTAKRPTVTLQFDPAGFPDGLGELQVFTRDGKGKVTAVTGVTVDEPSHTVSFKTKHFSAFQVFRVPPSDIRLLPGRAAGIGYFGQSVDGDASTAVVGAPYVSDGKGFGAAFVFVRNGDVWTEQARLEPSGPDPTDTFGYSVSLSGDTIAVGAIGGAQSPGAAYLFVRKGTKWTQQAKVVPDVRTNADFFGRSVSLDGDTLAVGGDRSDEGSADEGVVYVFVRDGTSWPKQERLLAGDGAGGDAFGSSVSVSGNTLVAGSPNRGTKDAGAAYVFERAGTAWTQLQRILASDASDFARFGTSVALSRNGTPRLVVGAKSSSVGASGAGEAYVYSRGPVAWDEDTKLFLADPRAGDTFGNAVAVDGDTVIVGAAGRQSSALGVDDTGTVSVYRLVLDVWTFGSEFRASQTRSGDDFGSSVWLSGTTLIVGSSRAHATGVSFGGAAYVFDVTPGP